MGAAAQARMGFAVTHWRVKFTRRGMEPPRPFGRTSLIVCAATRADAKSLVMVPASPQYPITASRTDAAPTWPYRCACGGAK